MSSSILLAVELKRLLYTYGEAAELLAVSEGFIKRLVSEGRLKKVVLTPGPKRQVRITCQSIVDYVKDRAAETDVPHSQQ